MYERPKSIRMADKWGEVGGLRVESAVGIQSRLPAIKPIPKSTSWRFGNLEKSKDRSKASLPSASGDSVSVNISGPGEGGEVQGTYNGRRLCMTVSRGSCCTLLRASRSRGGIHADCGLPSE